MVPLVWVVGAVPQTRAQSVGARGAGGARGPQFYGRDYSWHSHLRGANGPHLVAALWFAMIACIAATVVSAC